MWKNDIREGQGLFVWNNGNTYKGDWKDNKKTGIGLYTRANGDIYQGQWFEDKICGQGKFKWANGNTYDGDWVNNMRNGIGFAEKPYQCNKFNLKTLIMENGKMIKEMEKVKKNQLMVIIIKELGKMIFKKVKDLLNLIMGIFSQVTF